MHPWPNSGKKENKIFCVLSWGLSYNWLPIYKLTQSQKQTPLNLLILISLCYYVYNIGYLCAAKAQHRKWSSNLHIVLTIKWSTNFPLKLLSSYGCLYQLPKTVIWRVHPDRLLAIILPGAPLWPQENLLPHYFIDHRIWPLFCKLHSKIWQHRTN